MKKIFYRSKLPNGGLGQLSSFTVEEGQLIFDLENQVRDRFQRLPEFDPNGIRWLAGSTDGVAEDVDDVEPLILLEVKCPYRRKIVYGKCPEYSSISGDFCAGYFFDIWLLNIFLRFFSCL